MANYMQSCNHAIS